MKCAPRRGAIITRRVAEPRFPEKAWLREARACSACSLKSGPVKTGPTGPLATALGCTWGDNVICRSVPVVRFLAQSRRPDPHAQGGSGLRDYLGVLGLRNRGLQPPQPPPWIRPCTHFTATWIKRTDLCVWFVPWSRPVPHPATLYLIFGATVLRLPMESHLR